MGKEQGYQGQIQSDLFTAVVFLSQHIFVLSVKSALFIQQIYLAPSLFQAL